MPGYPIESIAGINSQITLAYRSIRTCYYMIEMYPEKREFYEEGIRRAYRRIESYRACITALQEGRSVEGMYRFNRLP